MAVLNSGLLGFTLDDVTEEMPSDQFEVMVKKGIVVRMMMLVL